jgi:chromosome condensin MukBEF MukE localization factor
MFKWYEMKFPYTFRRCADSAEEAQCMLIDDGCDVPETRELADDELTEDEREEMDARNGLI